MDALRSGRVSQSRRTERLLSGSVGSSASFDCHEGSMKLHVFHHFRHEDSNMPDLATYVAKVNELIDVALPANEARTTQQITALQTAFDEFKASNTGVADADYAKVQTAIDVALPANEARTT